MQGDAEAEMDAKATPKGKPVKLVSFTMRVPQTKITLSGIHDMSLWHVLSKMKLCPSSSYNYDFRRVGTKKRKHSVLDFKKGKRSGISKV